MEAIKLKPGHLKESLRCIEKYLNKKNIVEICINRPQEVWIENTKGKWQRFDDRNLSYGVLEKLIKNVANCTSQVFSEDYPIVATFVPEYGFRFMAAFGSAVADSGISISIRIGNALFFPLEDYFDKRTAAIIEDMMIKGENLLIAGGTSTGKTTLLNSLIQYIPNHLRIITLENMKELFVPQPNNVRLLVSESKSNKGYELAMNCILKSRPDRIFIGELTPQLSEYYIRLANTGHEGTCTTVHANSAKEGLQAVYENMLINNATESSALQKRVGNTIQHVIQCRRTGKRQIRARLYKTGFDRGEFVEEEVAA